MEISSKNTINTDKILCLFCDKAFSNNVERKNHVERDHKTILVKGKGSRKSERITKNISNSENSPFPGCFHCNKRSIRTDNLELLFQHLLASHKDVYFCCKCKIRTRDKISLASHIKSCKIGGAKSARRSADNLSDNRKTDKKSQIVKRDDKYERLSESEDSMSTSGRAQFANAIEEKSDRNKLKVLSKIASVNEKGRKSKSCSSSTISSSSSYRTIEDEYTIPLTRQKLKEPPTFARLGATQNRSSSNKKFHKTSKTTQTVDDKLVANTSTSTKTLRTKLNRVVNSNLQNTLEPTEVVQRIETITEFDEDFYKNISQNIKVNLGCYVDGKSDRLLNQPVFDKIASNNHCENEQMTLHEKEIHEATSFELSTPFPALLTAEQYGFGESNPNKLKRKITKNSWKWKWDLIKKYKYVNEGGKIVKKVKQITTGLKDLSQLDMWTQLSMRSRYESLNSANGMTDEFNQALNDSLSTRMTKTRNIKQLNHILDKRLIPQIDIEQLQQTIIKVEPEEKEELTESVDIQENELETGLEVLSMCNLVKANISKPSNPMLSGEWARPRCFICVDCGLKFDLMKSLNDHKNSEHPYVVSAHYEIVGRENLEQKLYKNLFLPKKALQTNGFARSLSVNSDSKSNETNEASTSSDNSSKFFVDQKERECSKCLKMIKYSSNNDIDRHILDCIEDRVWLQAKRRSKYRRSRRKNRKTTRRSRMSIDQKKTISSPSTTSTKDNTEGENSVLSTSNPPTPKNDLKNSNAITYKANKSELLLKDVKTANGKTKDGINIKNFFRVSKIMPKVPQKIIVQMMELPSQPTSLRTSLRSMKRTSNKSLDPKNDPALELEGKQVHGAHEDALKSEIKEQMLNKQSSDENNISAEIEAVSLLHDNVKSSFVPLEIFTSEKGTFDLQFCSSSSLISPTSTSNVPKKKKKLNDCIAMLTCKIQEKLGVSFFRSIADEPASVEKLDIVSLSPKTDIISAIEKKENGSKPSTSFRLESPQKERSSFDEPVQCEVIDLSIRKTQQIEDNALMQTSVKILQDIKHQKNSNDCLIKPCGTDNNHEEKVTEELSVCDTIVEMPDLQAKDKDELEINDKVVIIDQAKLEEIENLKEIEKLSNDIVTSSELPTDSFKISIPKAKIPNLNEILVQYQVITVNNIKISELERREFEEQKNRILKILNKTKNLKRKIAKRTCKKTTKPKAPTRKAANKRKEAAKPSSEVTEEKNSTKTRKIGEKIEEVIKTTNRIRCRRLSVLVDPMVSLSALQNKNRKIRLTNNSQQNGFYELLAASEQYFSDQKDKEISKCISPAQSTAEVNNAEKEKKDQPIPSSKTRVAKSNATKELKKLANDKDLAIKKIENFTQLKVGEVRPEILMRMTENNIEKPTDKKLCEKKQNVENIVSPVVVIEPLEDLVKAEKLKTTQSRTKQKKSTARTKKTSTPLEEIIVEQKSVKVSSKQQLQRKKSTRGKQTPKKENLLDASFTSDTSNENDIPLSRLVTPLIEDEEFRTVKKSVQADSTKALNVEVQKNTDEKDLVETIVGKDSEIFKEEVQETGPQVEGALKPYLDGTLLKTDLSATRDDSRENSFDPFTINDDSFFNDDLDNDPSDKINDLVNNIINSSEFQNDSESEKSETMPSKNPLCSICKRSFRNQKGYEKHCLTNTHVMKLGRKNRDVIKVQAEEALQESEIALTPVLDEAAKVFRTKGALKTFENIISSSREAVKPVIDIVVYSHKSTESLPNTIPEPELKPPQGNDDKLYYEFKMEKKPEDMTPKDKDQLFDSLFNSLEAKAKESQVPYAPLPISLSATSQDSEIESSSTSWDIKQDADIEWEADNNGHNVPFANAIKERYPKKPAVKINRSKDTAVSIPTKSLIMEKIFKKSRDREKQKIPQADAPTNKPGIKNSLDEIFDHLKNSAEIDDKVLTCPSPKTLLKNVGGIFSTLSSNSNDMLETASQPTNNNIYKSKVLLPTPDKELNKHKDPEAMLFNDLINEDAVDNGIGKRKSRRRCAIKAKTFAETWSSDEYEELHDPEDIMSIINEIEKRELIKKQKMLKTENLYNITDSSVLNENVLKNQIVKTEPTVEKKSILFHESYVKEKIEKKKSSQKSEKGLFSIRNRKICVSQEGHKSDEERFTATRTDKPIKGASSIKKRRMSCFIPSTMFSDHTKSKLASTKHSKEPLRLEAATLEKFERENLEFKAKSITLKNAESEKSFKSHKKIVNLLSSFGVQELSKKKTQIYRKRPRNKIKNIAYDSDSDFELNTNKKPKPAPISESSSSEDENEDFIEVTPTMKQTHVVSVSSRSSTVNDITVSKEQKFLPNDLKHVVTPNKHLSSVIFDDLNDSNACNRTKRHSSEKLYYWSSSSSSSSSESEHEQGDTADGEKEDSVLPHQPEQHGWIVGDSHKKLVTLLAHAKIKKKIN